MTPAAATRSAQLVKLRPVVHASPTPDGLHLRGWSSSVTLSGSPALWRVWQALAGRLAEGCAEAELHRLSDRPQVAAVVETLLTQLREHDMLVALPHSWPPAPVPGDTASWLESVAAEPADSWHRMSAATVRVDGGAALAAAAARALRTIGLRVERTHRAGALRLSAGALHVSADADESTGFVLPVGHCPHAGRIRARLGLGTGLPPAALAGLVAGAAAHRLTCAVAGLPETGDAYPSVFVARLDPLRGDYRPWPLAGPPQHADLEDALYRLAALTDPDLGPAVAVDAFDLPQTPAGLACVELGDGARVAAVGASTDAARVLAGVAAAEQLAGPAGAVAGCDELEATGRWLRRRVRPGAALDESAWTGYPPARRWWKALTLRLGVEATLSLSLVSDGVYHAEVRAGGDVLATAVEAHAGDAAAFAALAAVGLEQWRQSGRHAPTAFAAPCGAAPEPAAEPLAWQSRSWTWPAGCRGAETQFQRRLRDRALPPAAEARAGHVLVAAAR